MLAYNIHCYTHTASYYASEYYIHVFWTNKSMLKFKRKHLTGYKL